MKILLLGEYSGFHFHLARGLRALGHDVTVAGQRDGSKRIPVDISIDTSLNGVVGKIEKLYKSVRFSLLHDVQYDVIQVINPIVFPDLLGLNRTLMPRILSLGKRVFLSACGVDAVYLLKGAARLKYSPIQGWLREDLHQERYKWTRRHYIRWNERLAREACGIIPVAFDYYVGYQEYRNVRSVIPLPVDTSIFPMKQNELVNGKLVFMHGANRPGFKGSAYIKEAFSRVQARYPSDLEFWTPEGLPLQQYLDLMQRTNVVVDQATSYSLGMNALFSLASGKVVMGGAEPESLACIEATTSPVINIVPDSRQIEEQITALLDRRADLGKLSAASRAYVERHHSAIKVANEYLDAWRA